MPRYDWTDDELATKLDACINDAAMKAKLAATSAHMQSQSGPKKAAAILDQLAKTGTFDG
jgi:UDP:flavonoid glycosyltransferase YjiC (YdhE family)